jgi:L-rhamnose-proton symport protein (RhaT)
MGHPLAAGVALTMVAGLMSGNCMLPFKFLRSWKWENAWLVFSVVSLVILPWGLAVALVHHLFQTYGALTLQQFAAPVLLGAGQGGAWGRFFSASPWTDWDWASHMPLSLEWARH